MLALNEFNIIDDIGSKLVQYFLLFETYIFQFFQYIISYY
jgi:hypothetical protein